jgi:hypothetical protein
MEDVLAILGLDFVDVEGKDPHGDTPLLEASGGGQKEMIDLLVERGANVNAQGKFQRTPLFRAAFGGHHSAVLRLLQLGCDPRVHDAEGVVPCDVAANDKCRQHFDGWDITETERLGAMFAEERELKARCCSFDVRIGLLVRLVLEGCVHRTYTCAWSGWYAVLVMTTPVVRQQRACFSGVHVLTTLPPPNTSLCSWLYLSNDRKRL